MVRHNDTNAPITSPLRELAKNCRGNVTIAFGISALVMFTTAGGAIDFARWFSVKQKLHSVLDAASLAGGRALQLSSTDDYSVAIAAAQLYFDRMKPADLVGTSAQFTVLENGTVIKAQGNFSVATPFLSLIGISNLATVLTTEAVIAAGGNAGTNLEISLMLDMTGSMSGQKIEDLKLAAKDLIDIVVWSDQSQYTSKVALAPFSARVNVGDYLESVSDVREERSFGGGVQLRGITCVTERSGPEAFTDAKPVGPNRLSAYSADTGNAARDNPGNYSADGACKVSSGGSTIEIPKIMPLTSDKPALKARIDSLPAAGSTAGSLGTAWAWYLLSPLWTGIWQGDNLPAPYSDITTLTPKGLPKLQKVAVLMTDGIYNTIAGHNFGDGSAQSHTISANAVTICNNMKAQGIKVYTVGFQLGGDQLAIDTLSACASSVPGEPGNHSGYFFNASTGSELRGSFRQIALQLSTLRLRS